jgi:hypothetical protein
MDEPTPNYGRVAGPAYDPPHNVAGIPYGGVVPEPTPIGAQQPQTVEPVRYERPKKKRFWRKLNIFSDSPEDSLAPKGAPVPPPVRVDLPQSSVQQYRTTSPRGHIRGLWAADGAMSTWANYSEIEPRKAAMIISFKQRLVFYFCLFFLTLCLALSIITICSTEWIYPFANGPDPVAAKFHMGLWKNCTTSGCNDINFSGYNGCYNKLQGSYGAAGALLIVGIVFVYICGHQCMIAGGIRFFWWRVPCSRRLPAKNKFRRRRRR